MEEPQSSNLNLDSVVFIAIDLESLSWMTIAILVVVFLPARFAFYAWFFGSLYCAFVAVRFSVLMLSVRMLSVRMLSEMEMNVLAHELEEGDG